MRGVLKKMLLIVLPFAAMPAIAQYSDPTALGKVLFNKWCTPCHAPDANQHFPGTVALQVKYKGKKPAALEQRTDLTPELITTTVRHGVSIMPIFRKTEINDLELEAIIRYLTNREKMQQR